MEAGKKEKVSYLIPYIALGSQARVRPDKDLWALVVGEGSASPPVLAAEAHVLVVFSYGCV